VQRLSLHHVAIRTSDLATTLEFYASMLNLHPGPRPDFPLPGAWLYAEGSDTPVVHVVEVAQCADTGSGMFDHFSFVGSDLAAYLKKVKQLGSKYSLTRTPGMDIVQIQHRDPNNVIVEVTFFGEPVSDEEIVGW
jgi:catechol 2,3-dioxygenase-like lactoylglutathione lyase family enzyme